MAVGAFAIGNGMCRRLGLVSGSYTGARWPYLYTYRRGATRGRRRHLLDLLDNMAD